MYKWFFRTASFVGFLWFLARSNRAHHWEPDDQDDDEYEGDLHTEGFDARKT